MEFVKTEVSQEQLSNTFDEIANAIINDDEMFQNDDNGDNLVDDPDDSDECLDISEENTSHLYIENFIDLNNPIITKDIDIIYNL